MIEDWAKVGIRVMLQDKARLFYAESRGRAHDMTVWSGESEFFPLMSSRNFVPTNAEFLRPRLRQLVQSRRHGRRPQGRARTSR